MKKYTLCIVLALLAIIPSYSQNSYSDNFESYTVGQFIGVQSAQFTTGDDPEGGQSDALVTNTDAHSGTKSVFLESSDDDEIFLMLGNEMTTGHLSMEAQFKIPVGGNCFNYLYKKNDPWQGNSMLFYFNDGTLRFEKNFLSFETDYPQGVWFNFRLEIDQNNSMYKVFINDVYKGSFNNHEIGIASWNFAVYFFERELWLDDVQYQYTPFTAPNLNAAVSFVDNTVGIAGQQRKVDVRVRNLGNTAINSLTLNVAYNGNNFSQTFNSLNIAPNDIAKFTFNNQITLGASTVPMRVYVTGVNTAALDNYRADDTVTVTMKTIVPAPGRVVVSEEGTGTWCGFCPRGAVAFDRMERFFHTNFEGIAVHNGDPMTIDEYDVLFNDGGYPTAQVDRTGDRDPIDIQDKFIERVQLPPSALIHNTAIWNAVTRELKVALTYDFQTSVTEDDYWAAALVLTEDGVTGTGSQWWQSNYYSNGTQEMGGYELMDSHLNPAGYKFNNVARYISELNGQMGVFPSSIDANTLTTLNYSVTIPQDWNIDSLTIIGLLFEPYGDIDNAGVATFQEATGQLSGVNESNISTQAMSVFPNPTVDYSTVKFNVENTSDVLISVKDITGKEVYAKNYGSLNGQQTLILYTEMLAPGVYIIQLQMNGKTYSQKLIKQ